MPIAKILEDNFFEALKKGDTNTLHHLLRENPNVDFNQFNSRNQLPLLWAAQYGQLASVQWLLSNFPFLFDKRRNPSEKIYAAHKMVLCYATHSGSLPVFQWLHTTYPELSYQLMLNKKTIFHLAVHYVCKTSDATLLMYLLTLPNIEELCTKLDDKGLAPIHYL